MSRRVRVAFGWPKHGHCADGSCPRQSQAGQRTRTSFQRAMCLQQAACLCHDRVGVLWRSRRADSSKTVSNRSATRHAGQDGDRSIVVGRSGVCRT
ncbi:hypothetical protein VFPFJ_03429 [Purpureocillium lilacinum]|uniref:Uncharacterized protein n=1 Tax=Purpureocillium lilacinum TaxID=33203 RepID=A0A179HQE8_PURLI|nr:hypothetical protein VFPFJ_03429 [Purpureocillium lilacinum]OAQ91689.1 hypothetical protein VFPFJ_03429 [Purpureocillium lilacinum]